MSCDILCLEKKYIYIYSNLFLSHLALLKPKSTVLDRRSAFLEAGRSNWRLLARPLVACHDAIINILLGGNPLF